MAEWWWWGGRLGLGINPYIILCSNGLKCITIYLFTSLINVSHASWLDYRFIGFQRQHVNVINGILFCLQVNNNLWKREGKRLFNTGTPWFPWLKKGEQSEHHQRESVSEFLWRVVLFSQENTLLRSWGFMTSMKPVAKTFRPFSS